tara:strand:+ start:723 stop:914 length:192 start_codon:yes stop_codon:yes gene_type:complete
MRFKIKKPKRIVYKNEFVILPREFNGYKYFLCWVTIKAAWLGHHYSRFGEIVAIGKKADKFNT